jgi:hypothetical protein
MPFETYESSSPRVRLIEFSHPTMDVFEASSLRDQLLIPAAEAMRLRVMSASSEDWTEDKTWALLSEAAKAAAERAVPLPERSARSALLYQKSVLEEMANHGVSLRYGEAVRCLEIAKRLPKACREVASRFRKQVEKFNKVRRISKLKIASITGLSKPGPVWLEDERNACHMSEMDMEAFPDRFEGMLSDMCHDPEILQFGSKSRKSAEDYLKVVLLQPVLKEAQVNMSLDGILTTRFGTDFDLSAAEHSQFLESLKQALLVKMKGHAAKAQM